MNQEKRADVLAKENKLLREKIAKIQRLVDWWKRKKSVKKD